MFGLTPASGLWSGTTLTPTSSSRQVWVREFRKVDGQLWTPPASGSGVGATHFTDSTIVVTQLPPLFEGGRVLYVVDIDLVSLRVFMT